MTGWGRLWQDDRADCEDANYTADAWIVHDYTIIGTPNDDEPLSFNWGNGAENLGPHGPEDLLGFIYGREGRDLILGSGHSGNTYRDNLYGEEGDDEIDGYADGDFIVGGPDDDTLRGDGGNDTILGGTGEDTLEGDAGNDTLCDIASLPGIPCPAAGSQLFDGGAGSDQIWYERNPSSCTSSEMDINSDAGGGDDYCGSANWNTLPANCENPTLLDAPSKCAGPN